MTPSVLFVQMRPQRAGAQTCLLRLLRHSVLRRWNPMLLTSSEGWLTAECQNLGIPVVCEPFPSSRSLPARAWGNTAFARRVARRLRDASLRPSIVHANDHMEGLLGLKIAARLAARTVMFLRSPSMVRRDYFKYRCDEYDIVAAVCDALYERARQWEGEGRLRLIYDGIEEQDFVTPKPKADRPPKRLLIVGSPLAWKGWADLTEAIYLLEQKESWRRLQLDFTGVRPDGTRNDLKLDRLKTVDARFLGRVEGFRTLLREYDLVVVPSRMECFGTAAVETLAAGVPLLTTGVGAVVRVLNNPELFVPPGRPDLLAEALKNVFERWSEIDFGIAAAQEEIRHLYHVDRAAEQLDAAYRELSRR